LTEVKSRIWLVVVTGFGAVVALMLVSVWAFDLYVVSAQTKINLAEADYLARDHALNDLRSGILLLAIELRDLAFGASSVPEEEQVKRIIGLHDSILRSLAEVQKLTGPEESAQVRELQADTDGYWQIVQTVLNWTEAERKAGAAAFLKQDSLPSREAILQVIKEIDAISAAVADSLRDDLRQNSNSIRARRNAVALVAELLTVIILGLTVVRLRSLERSAEQYRRRTEEGAEELRRLSQQLVKAQEEERKSVSRELHDQLGQMLTALKMDLGNLRDALASRGEPESDYLAAADKLAEEILHGVREVAHGLRPAMLDELGLVSALKSHVREFAKRSGISVNLQTDGDLDLLPETHRTCLYRIVQEGLTNCARHARASSVDIHLSGYRDRLTLTINDDGVGLDRQRGRQRGLGLVGVEERVRELGGHVALTSEPSQGVLLRIEIPMPLEGTDGPRSSTDC
jgi:signal transduction histidine kinase